MLPRFGCRFRYGCRHRFSLPVPLPPPFVFAFRACSARATDTHTIPLNVIKLGFVISGHEFDGDSDEDHGGVHQTSRENSDEQEAYRYDQLKATLATLIVQVRRDRPRFDSW